MKKGKNPPLKVVCENRKARFNYHIEEVLEAGLVLTGSEAKSLRAGRANINDAFVELRGGECYLKGAHISPYSHASQPSEPTRRRKLLLHAREIRRLTGKSQQKGYTIIPLRIYFKNSWAKAEIALAKGKKLFDKRETIKRREQKREMEKAIKRRH